METAIFAGAIGEVSAQVSHVAESSTLTCSRRISIHHRVVPSRTDPRAPTKVQLVASQLWTTHIPSTPPHTIAAAYEQMSVRDFEDSTKGITVLATIKDLVCRGRRLDPFKVLHNPVHTLKWRHAAYQHLHNQNWSQMF